MFLLDLKKFFPNGNHNLIFDRHKRFMLDRQVCSFADTIVKHSPCETPGRGMPLGVEPSQQEMVSLQAMLIILSNVSLVFTVLVIIWMTITLLCQTLKS